MQVCLPDAISLTNTRAYIQHYIYIQVHLHMHSLFDSSDSKRF